MRVWGMRHGLFGPADSSTRVFYRAVAFPVGVVDRVRWMFCSILVKLSPPPMPGMGKPATSNLHWEI